MPRHANFVEEIVSEVSDALKDAETNIRREWHWAKGEWSQSQASNDFRSAKVKFRNVPNRVSDLATDGSCFMRYVFAYSTKGFASLMGLGGLITAVLGFSQGHDGAINWATTVCLCLLVFAQLTYWAGHRIQKSADPGVQRTPHVPRR